MQNRLFYGDNLDVLQRYIKDETVDLVYLDPPFNSNANYNVLFAEHDGSKAASQLHAFEDTWEWNEEAARSYHGAVEAGGRVSQAMQAFHAYLGRSDMMAYLAMMAPRLAELWRVLKPSGSLYLHCDPTASHYLKILIDATFGPKRFMNEIIWKRSSAHSDTKQGMRRYGRIHDVLLFYTKSDEYRWTPQFTAYDQGYLASEYRHVTEDGRRYKEGDCTAAKPGGDTEFLWEVKRRGGEKCRWEPDFTKEYQRPRAGWEYKQVPPYEGRYWAYSKDNLATFWNQGKLIHRSTGVPRLMLFANEMPGISLQDLWTDIPPESGNRDLGFATQKPQPLLERIIQASSRPGDLVLDPFCGCGTTIAAAHALGRHWIGIDIAQAAVRVIRKRFRDHFQSDIPADVIGEPTTASDARQLAVSNPYQFQWWSLGLVDARPTEGRKGADQGIDGRRYFADPTTGKTDQIVFSIKAGHVSVSHIRDLRGVMERERAAMGALICMEEPTKPMRAEAAAAGFVKTPWGQYPRIQIRSIEELLFGKRLDAPNPLDVTYKLAPRAIPRVAEQQAEFNLEPPKPSKKTKMAKASLPLGFRQLKAPKTSKRDR